MSNKQVNMLQQAAYEQLASDRQLKDLALPLAKQAQSEQRAQMRCAPAK